MPHYKNSDNKLFYLDEGTDPVKWLPSDCIKITEDEAKTISNELNQTKLTAEQEIIQLETTITPRRLREALLTTEGKVWLTNIEDKIRSLRLGA